MSATAVALEWHRHVFKLIFLLWLKSTDLPGSDWNGNLDGLCERFCVWKQGCLGMSADRSKDVLAGQFHLGEVFGEEQLSLVTVATVAC